MFLKAVSSPDYHTNIWSLPWISCIMLSGCTLHNCRRPPETFPILDQTKSLKRPRWIEQWEISTSDDTLLVEERDPLEIIRIFQNFTKNITSPSRYFRSFLLHTFVLPIALCVAQIGNNFNLLKPAMNFMYSLG